MMDALKYQRLTILWALFVFAMCNAKFGHVGESHLFFPGFDKMVHCGFFFVLTVFWCNGLIRQQNTRVLQYKYAIGIGLLAIAFGGLIELLQLTVFTWRDGDWNDLFADSVGVGMAIFSILVTVNAVNHVKS